MTNALTTREAARRLGVVERDLRVRAAADVVVRPDAFTVHRGRDHELLEAGPVGIRVAMNQTDQLGAVSGVLG